MLLAPPGERHVQDARLLEWVHGVTPASPGTATCVAWAKARDVRLSLLAEQWKDPRVFEPGGRFEAMVVGLTNEQRRGRIAEIARGLNHWAIPQEEKMHLLVTSHHGLRQGAKKEKGEKALCACCLRNGHRIEETAQHEHHDCPTARAVWQQVAAAWLQATGESVDINSPLLTIMGLRARRPT